jgi:hypothetical protein
LYDQHTVFSKNRSFQTGNVRFDATFKIKSHDKHIIQKFFVPEIQEQFFTFQSSIDLEFMLKDDRFELKVSGIPTQAKEYEPVIRVALACLDQLDRLYGNVDNPAKDTIIQKDVWRQQVHTPFFKGVLLLFVVNMILSRVFAYTCD